ncbi:TRAP transporter permease [Oribacterium sp. WCC10]|uniref:TRAP transporter permease n=1 Tax=Oribacterium sp. WCC10 TaxID=1855343 RepID=UPI0008E73042|nr:TRAP transporter fused permease subunit [Oribacterium sp. WCC10]SFG50765.1 TRAP transporter, 4TM/12TM fusion protein [Oribacterium sp. WCC10]
MTEHKIDLRKIAIVIVTIAFFGFQMYLALIKQLTPMLQSPLHLVLALFVVFLYNPIDKKYRKSVTKKAEAAGRTPDEKELNKWAFLNYIDVLSFAGIFYMLWYTVSQYSRLRDFVQFISPVTTVDKIAMVITIILLLEAVRRTLGNILFGFIIVFILYAWTAPYLPGILFTKGKSFKQMLDQFTTGMTMTEAGVFGTPLYTSASSLFYFIVFGVFFSECGGGQLLIDIGMKFSNKSSGGPAKAAVISSGLMGMVSGSAVANVSTTGVMTIPMMKKIGYEPEEAGAIEAVASTGGQVMPPIMGVGAFIMAEMLGVSYFKVASSAILPAVAYYFGVFVLVTYLAKKRASKAGGSEDVKISIDQPILPRLYLLIPVILLVFWIIRGSSLMRSGMVGIFSCLVCNVVSYFVANKRNFIGIRELGKCCINGAKQAAEIAIPTAACGIIINVVTGQTSLATNLSSLIGSLGTNYLFLALLIAMIGCMLLGMALPTVAAYLVGVILFVPVLRSLGIEPLVANMFVFYFGIMAQITPPVCVASYTAAGIADGDAMKTGLKGMLFALVGFLVPFVFVYNPAVLLIGTPVEILIAGTQLLVGTFFLAITVSGYFHTTMPAWQRAVSFVAAMCFIFPDIASSIVGVVIGVAVLFINAKSDKKTVEVAGATQS